MRTLQEIFDTAYLGLLKQGTPATNNIDNACKYRTSDGRKCAVGMLIKDEYYDSVFENVPVRAAMPSNAGPDFSGDGASARALGTALERSGIDISNLSPERSLLIQMQAAHDEYAKNLVPREPFGQYIRETFAIIAGRFNLTVPEG